LSFVEGLNGRSPTLRLEPGLIDLGANLLDFCVALIYVCIHTLGAAISESYSELRLRGPGKGDRGGY
jgi:hypothetical protein